LSDRVIIPFSFHLVSDKTGRAGVEGKYERYEQAEKELHIGIFEPAWLLSNSGRYEKREEPDCQKHHEHDEQLNQKRFHCGQ
jgi:hypothetical protein